MGEKLSVSNLTSLILNQFIATTTVINCGKNIGRFDVHVTNGKQELVAKYNGTVFFTEENW
jgi:acyl-coenzyme A thioesterase PaaI-like protein